MQDKTREHNEEFAEAQETFEREYDGLLGEIEALERRVNEQERDIEKARRETTYKTKARIIEDRILDTYDTLIVTRSKYDEQHEGIPLREYESLKMSEEDEKSYQDATKALELPPEFVNHEKAKEAVEEYLEKKGEIERRKREYNAYREQEQQILGTLKNEAIILDARQSGDEYIIKLPIEEKEHYRTLEKDLINMAHEKLKHAEGTTYIAGSIEELRQLKEDYKNTLGINVSIILLKEEEI